MTGRAHCQRQVAFLDVTIKIIPNNVAKTSLMHQLT